MIAGGLLLLMKNVFGFGPFEIACVVPAVVIPWIITGFSVTRRYPGMVAAAIAGHRFDAATLSLTDSTSVEILKAKLHSSYATEVLYARSFACDGNFLVSIGPRYRYIQSLWQNRYNRTGLPMLPVLTFGQVWG